MTSYSEIRKQRIGRMSKKWWRNFGTCSLLSCLPNMKSKTYSISMVLEQNRSNVVDPIFTIRQLIENRCKNNRTLQQLFIYFKQTYMWSCECHGRTGYTEEAYYSSKFCEERSTSAVRIEGKLLYQYTVVSNRKILYPHSIWPLFQGPQVNTNNNAIVRQNIITDIDICFQLTTPI